MRVALLYPQPDAVSPANWSGIPSGLARGLEACGIDVVPVGARLPLGMHQAVAVLSRIGGRRGAVADRMPVRQWARTRVLTENLARVAGSLDAVIAMGTEMYDLAAVRYPHVPVATFDDGTLRQMWDNPDSDIRQSRFPEDQVKLWFDRQAASSRAADVCCVSTGWAARSFVADYGVSSARVSVVGMGHRPRAVSSSVVSASAGPRDWSVPRFLFIGVDWQRKNGAAVLAAFAELRTIVPSATLDIVGRHPPIDQAGVTGHGFLPREQPQAQALLDGLFSAATVFVLPSRFDPSPIAYLEAASAGLPVIATSEGGAGELLGAAAITVHPDDRAALVSAMVRLADPGVARAMGEEAALRARSASWSGVAQRILLALDIPVDLPVRGGVR
ncbi:glycosyltransferase [Cryobacterium frigoriphilum]|uniref:Glycosyltransferase n=1 Tax=Cryobacterium frigoriphilum TaxID=1259150 RepID=A0A4R9A4V7_9MICO|nr:glycosyltransferase family 4 protein [Cryobacterium frigoriphilum]TFD52125.1 glycosyltransferase [Cryobacterium frigoriphilum]